MVKNIKNVEILCKTMRKSLRFSRAKLCVDSKTKNQVCVNPHFPTNFSRLFHTNIHNQTLSIPNYSFPLFHQVYYYNFNKLIIRNN